MRTRAVPPFWSSPQRRRLSHNRQTDHRRAARRTGTAVIIIDIDSPDRDTLEQMHTISRDPSSCLPKTTTAAPSARRSGRGSADGMQGKRVKRPLSRIPGTARRAGPRQRGTGRAQGDRPRQGALDQAPGNERKRGPPGAAQTGDGSGQKTRRRSTQRHRHHGSEAHRNTRYIPSHHPIPRRSAN